MEEADYHKVRNSQGADKQNQNRVAKTLDEKKKIDI